MKEKYYITMAIAYASRIPHVGNAYEAVLTDTLARFKKQQGYDVYFLTGTDEHGQKINDEAREQNRTPQEHVDLIAAEVKNIWDLLGVEYDQFIRTTAPKHKQVVQKIYQKLYDQGDIYKDEYEGLYCVACESFYTESQLVDGRCPVCSKEVINMKEEAYFFKLSKYEDRLKKYIQEHSDFIYPESRKNEMLNNFIDKGLKDLSVSRTSFDWGIPLGFDPKHVSYVWIDALSNYITALGYLQEDDSLFKKYWPADLHVIGKDIVRFHTIYWPIFLMALDLPLPKRVYGHPWMLMGAGKISKSTGNVLYAQDLVAKYGRERVRWSMLREMPFSEDGNFSEEALVERTNHELANIIGNLLNRSIAMNKKYFDSVVPSSTFQSEREKELEADVQEHMARYEELMESLQVTKAMDEIVEIAKKSNKYIDVSEPWILAKDEQKREELACVIRMLLENLRKIGVLLAPFIPETSRRILDALGTKNRSYTELGTSELEENLFVPGVEVLFERMEYVEAPKEKEAEFKEEINYDDFAKLDLRVATIINAIDHPNADKLFVITLKVEGSTRQVCSGLRDYYKAEDLIGKQVLYLANLKPRKLRGELSQGMILAEEKDGIVKIIEGTLASGVVS